MIYYRVDVQFPRHPRALKAGRDARDLWYWAQAYANELLTDGLIPREALVLYPYEDREECAARLVEVGLWETCDEGWRICRFFEKGGQRKDEVDEKRAADRERKASARSSEKRIKSSEPVRADSARTASASVSDSDLKSATRAKPTRMVQTSLPMPIGSVRLLGPAPLTPEERASGLEATTAILSRLCPPIEVQDRPLACAQGPP